MPRGVYDRSKMKKAKDKPGAAVEKRAPARKAAVKHRTVAKKLSIPKQYRSKPLAEELQASIKAVERKNALKTFYGILDTVTTEKPQLVIFESVEDVVGFMRTAWGYSDEHIASEQDAKVLVFESVKQPELRSIQLSYTLKGEQASDTIQS